MNLATFKFALKLVVKHIIKFIILFVIYGGIYFLIETIFKQKLTDYRMFILGGILAVIIGFSNNFFSWDTSLLFQCIFGCLLITLSEAIFGYHWNIEQGLNIWDYSNLPLSGIDGQVNVFFSLFAWLPLSCFCIILDDYLRYWLFEERKPKYKIL